MCPDQDYAHMYKRRTALPMRKAIRVLAGCVQLASVVCRLAWRSWKSLHLASIVISSLRKSCPAMLEQHLHRASMPDKPARACAQQWTCCRHKVAHRLPLARDCEVLNSTTCCWHFRTAGWRRRIWLRLSATSPLRRTCERTKTGLSYIDDERLWHSAILSTYVCTGGRRFCQQKPTYGTTGDNTETSRRMYVVIAHMWR
jgi:hypothetical protein